MNWRVKWQRPIFAFGFGPFVDLGEGWSGTIDVAYFRVVRNLRWLSHFFNHLWWFPPFLLTMCQRQSLSRWKFWAHVKCKIHLNFFALIAAWERLKTAISFCKIIQWGPILGRLARRNPVFTFCHHPQSIFISILTHIISLDFREAAHYWLDLNFLWVYWASWGCKLSCLGNLALELSCSALRFCLT